MRYITFAITMALSSCSYAGWDMATPDYSVAQDRSGNLVARSYAVNGTTYTTDRNGNYVGQVQPATRTQSTVFDANQNYVGQVSRSSHEIPAIPAIPSIPSIPR